MQELEKILEEVDETIERYGKNPYIDEKVTDLCYGLNIAKEIIHKHMSGKDTDVPTNDGWIPVEERLPEDDSMVLVTCQTKKGIRSVNRAYCDGAFWHGSGSMSGVIAWRPLPEPYRTERSEGE